MKLFRLSSVVLLLAALFFSGCKGKAAKDQIVNKWKLTAVSGDGAAKMSDAEKKDMIDKLVVEFTKDGKCSMSGEGDTPKTGTYTLSDDGKTLMMTQDGSEKADQMDVSEISGSKLVFSDTKENMTMTFQPK
jgi:hypothetical protein